MPRSKITATLEQKISALTSLPRAELVARWRSQYRADPPKGISRVLLLRAIAYEMQVNAIRGLKPAVKRRLQAPGDTPQIVEPAHRPALQPGARLIREWNESTHRVEVVEGGFVWNGKQYRSLSAIARAITGAHWSGPRFFGLRMDSAS